MGIDDGLIDAYFLFENFEPLEDELTGVESAEIIADCDVMTVSDVTKEEAVDNILPSDVFGETDATPEKRPLPAEEEHSELTGPMEGTLELVEKDIVFEEEVPDLETKIISEPVA